MELHEVMRVTGACRAFRPDPVDDDVLWELFDLARFAPSGGNRQPYRFIVVRDQAVKRRLRDLYLVPWNAYLEKSRSGQIGNENSDRVVAEADHFANTLDQVPVLVVIGVKHSDLHITDAQLDRPSIVGGASVYPAVQNLLLACRARGLGATMTSLLAQFEPEIKDMLGMPEDIGVAGTIAIGWPEGKLTTKLRRRPVEELVFLERYGEPLRRGEPTGRGPARASGG